MANKEDSTFLSGVIDQYMSQTKKHYPGFEFGSRYSWYNGDEPTSCEFEFRLISSNLDKTEYQIKRNLELIHYSPSIQNICEILNNGYLRLSNLIALNDPQELSFVTKHLEMDFDDNQIDEYKNQYFTASFCKVINKEKPDNFSMWRLYGNDGLGAAVVFEVINPFEKWHNFLLANVQYGECKAVERFKSFFSSHNLFQQKNNYPIQNLPIALSALMALHKNKIWEQEKEVRLLTHQEFNRYSLKNDDHHICELKHSISRNGVKYAYAELPLYKSKEYLRMEDIVSYDTLKTLIPVFKIKKVIVGYRNSYETLNNLNDIVNFVSQSYGYNIATQLSSLRNEMT